jgi:hypothetical protein
MYALLFSSKHVSFSSNVTFDRFCARMQFKSRFFISHNAIAEKEISN